MPGNAPIFLRLPYTLLRSLIVYHKPCHCFPLLIVKVRIARSSYKQLHCCSAAGRTAILVVNDAGIGRTAQVTTYMFHEEAARQRRDHLLLVRSAYRQPFGIFSGMLSGGMQLREAYGVMERHEAVW